MNFPVQEKFIIYQVLPRLFGNTNEHCVPNASIELNSSGKLCDFDSGILKSIRELGCTHIWFTGIIEHATKTDYSNYGIIRDYPSIVKGEAGSPFAIKDYFDIDPDLAKNIPNRISEFQKLLNDTHKIGMKVIIDFVPNHLARIYHSDMKPDYIEDFGLRDKKDLSFNSMNNYYYLLNEHFKSPVVTSNQNDDYKEFPAKVTGNDCFSSNPNIYDWYETVKLNYGVDYMNNRVCYFNPVPDTWEKMNTIIQYWINMGVDGFRCDMAEMVPVEFWQWAIKNAKKMSPQTLFIAEIYNPEQYSNYLNIGGFDYLYDKVGLYDNLKNILKGKASASLITTSWQSLGENHSRMLNFLENHDEQRIASEFFLVDPHLVMPALAVSLLFNTTPFMIYFGQELGEKGMDAEGFSKKDGKTSIFDYWSVETIRKWIKTGDEPLLRTVYKKLLNMSLNESAFRLGKTFDLCYTNNKSEFFDSDYQFAFFRFYDKELILVVVNFEDKEKSLRINVPEQSFEYFQVIVKSVDFGIDLLSGDIINEPLTFISPYRIALQANDIRVIKFLLQ